MQHRGYAAWITDEHEKRLQEYAVEISDDRKTISCHVPSESGQRFIMHWEDRVAIHHFDVSTKLDGRYSGSSTCPPGRSGERIGMRISSSADVYNAYQFADLPTTDDDDVPTAAVRLGKLGTIEMNIQHIHADCQQLEAMSAVHERSKKAGAHYSVLGRPVKVATSHMRCRTTPLNPGDGPYVTFIFHYSPAGARYWKAGILVKPDRTTATYSCPSGAWHHAHTCIYSNKPQ
ncbi:hypothetical protein BV20DRAFT_943891 [Pilatotrama ljubarskyi]|nr:hypothetical protein BV20DRAFT_943891 [Pilatotrama ljubarskyi]